MKDGKRKMIFSTLLLTLFSLLTATCGVPPPGRGAVGHHAGEPQAQSNKRQSQETAHARADTIYYNGNMYSWHHHGLRRLQAMRVQQGVIRATGANETVLRDATAADQCIDLQGRTVLPGLIDSHGHLQGLGAFGLGRLDLSNAASFADVVGAVKDAASRATPGEWILGGRWDHESWPEKNLPSHAPLSAVSPNNPVWLRRVDGHASWVNSKALAAARIDRTTKDPAGGTIVRDARFRLSSLSR